MGVWAWQPRPTTKHGSKSLCCVRLLQGLRALIGNTKTALRDKAFERSYISFRNAMQRLEPRIAEEQAEIKPDALPQKRTREFHPLIVIGEIFQALMRSKTTGECRISLLKMRKSF